MLADERRQRIVELVQARGFASLTELTEALGVSESTVRRDLERLEEAGQAKRTHGGVFYAGASPKLPHFAERSPQQWGPKKAIARVAAKLIEDDDTVLLDGGSTTYEVARLLVGRPLQIVTNSLPVANLFASSADTDLVLVGGYITPRTGVALGPYANEMIARLNVRRTVLSVGGVTERGYYNSNLLLVETERQMLEAADEVIVVADSSKFGHQSLAHLCPLEKIDRLVVDERLPTQWRQRLRQAGVDLILAPLDESTAEARDSATANAVDGSDRHAPKTGRHKQPPEKGKQRSRRRGA